MLRRLAALGCLLALVAGLAAAVAHDHLGADATPQRRHGCLQCSGAVEPPAPPVLPPSPESAAFVSYAPPQRPFVASRLNLAHSGNAPPSCFAA